MTRASTATSRANKVGKVDNVTVEQLQTELDRMTAERDRYRERLAVIARLAADLAGPLPDMPPTSSPADPG